ncbi:MAG: queuosine precursor transporter [Pseudomonadota bacterium]|nr:queuosine precursor transporter [Pseudomonadota bacterium]
MQEILANQELIWLLTVIYDLGMALLLFRFFGKYGLYTAVILGIMLANLQGGKISELELFGYTFTASMGAILYSGIYFATDILNERYGKKEADRAVMLGFFANVAVMITLLLSIQFKPSNLVGSAAEVHNSIVTLAGYSPAFVIGSLTAYLISQRFDVWFFHTIKSYTGESKLWLRNNLSTITSQLIDTMIYQFTWVIAVGMSFQDAFALAAVKYVFKVFIALVDTIFIYWVRYWDVENKES